MYPLIGEGFWSVETYFLMGLIGFLVASALVRRDAPRVGFSPYQAVDLTLVLIIVGIVGARLFHVLFDGQLGDYIALCSDPKQLAAALPIGAPCTADEVCLAAQNKGYDVGALCDLASGKCVPEQDCLRALEFWQGGLTWYGGLVLAIPATWWLGRRWKWPFLRMADLLSPSVIIGLGFGRIGCFLSGCCFGNVCELPWAVRFPSGSAAYRLHREEHSPALVAQYKELGEWVSLPVHPTQLYESLACFAIFAALWFGVRPRARRDGEVFGWLLILYAVARFTLELWRADQRGGAWLLSTSQWISVPMLLAGVLVLWMSPERQLVRWEPPSTKQGENDGAGSAPGDQDPHVS